MGGITESSYATRTIRVVCEENPLDACQMPEPPYRSSLNQVNCSECRSEGDLCYYSFYSPFYKMEDESCISQYTFIISNDNSYNNITDENNLLELLHTGFEIKWNISDECTSCENSSGICYNPYYYNNFQACICSDGPHQYNCLDGILLYHEKWQMLSKYKAALGAISGAFVISIIVFIYRRIRRKRKEREQQEERDIRRFMDPLDSRPPSVANFLQAGIPNKYSHRQIKRYTNNFAVKLGQGGFEWAFKQVEMGEFQNLRGDNITDEEDEIVAKKLSMLGLWCIQYNPSHRPSMSKVIQMLEGTVDITMPPQPFSIDTPVQTAASTESSSSI
ncbi:hypothetical protein SUGI_1411640 [Cryptomeria japonica]|uniref:Wall-associated receptor kinase C-terminal domain-containing protein n=1 Tax=Cryptomeria japonica TaxID=3369 RepID=A0AAD3RR23_CRYJA|nr:hypothetical protein SUGI_1411640 [Cryptomeria japonica]